MPGSKRATKMTALGLAVLCALAAAGCAAKEGSVGILYRVTGGKNSMALLGSIHVGGDAMYPLGRHILEELDAADTLAFECDTQSREARAVYASLMNYPAGESLAGHVSAETLELARQAADKAGYSFETLEGMKPWAVLSLLNTEMVAAKMGAGNARAATALGVEAQVRKLGAGKREVWLETTENELEVLDGLSPELQEDLLKSVCRVVLNPDSAAGMDAAMDQWPGWWRDGDADAFAGAYLEGMKAEPQRELALEYHKALVTDRNAGMARRMAEWLEAGEKHSYFVTVGLLHLTLPGDSVIEELQSMGYTVERVWP